MLELWQQSIAMLRKEAQMIEDEQPMDMLARIASQTGITTCCSGDFPVAKDTQKLFVQAAAEALRMDIMMQWSLPMTGFLRTGPSQKAEA